MRYIDTKMKWYHKNVVVEEAGGGWGMWLNENYFP